MSADSTNECNAAASIAATPAAPSPTTTGSEHPLGPGTRSAAGADPQVAVECGKQDQSGSGQGEGKESGERADDALLRQQRAATATAVAFGRQGEEAEAAGVFII